VELGEGGGGEEEIGHGRFLSISLIRPGSRGRGAGRGANIRPLDPHWPDVVPLSRTLLPNPQVRGEQR